METTLVDDVREDFHGICEPVIKAVHADAAKDRKWADALVDHAKQLVAFQGQRDEWRRGFEAWEAREPERRQSRLEFLKDLLAPSDELRRNPYDESLRARSDELRRRLLGRPPKLDGDRKRYCEVRPVNVAQDGYAMVIATDEEQAICRRFGICAIGKRNFVFGPGELAFPEALVEPPPEPTFRSSFGPDPLDTTVAPKIEEAAVVRLSMIESWLFPDNSIIGRAMELVDSESPEWMQLAVLRGCCGPRSDRTQPGLERFFSLGAADVAVEDELRRWFKLATARVFGEAVIPPADAGNPTEKIKNIKLPSLTKEDCDILDHLRTHYPECRIQVDITMATGIERRRLGDRLRSLREKGFTERPEGPRKGESLTELGIELADRFIHRAKENNVPH